MCPRPLCSKLEERAHSCLALVHRILATDGSRFRHDAEGFIEGCDAKPNDICCMRHTEDETRAAHGGSLSQDMEDEEKCRNLTDEDAHDTLDQN